MPNYKQMQQHHHNSIGSIKHFEQSRAFLDCDHTLLFLCKAFHPTFQMNLIPLWPQQEARLCIPFFNSLYFWIPFLGNSPSFLNSPRGRFLGNSLSWGIPFLYVLAKVPQLWVPDGYGFGREQKNGAVNFWVGTYPMAGKE